MKNVGLFYSSRAGAGRGVNTRNYIFIAEVYFSLQNIKKLCIWSIKAHLPYIYVMYYFRPHKNKILIQIMALQERNLNP